MMLRFPRCTLRSNYYIITVRHRFAKHQQQQSTMTQEQGTGRNLKNAVIAFLVPLPSILFYHSFLTNHHNNNTSFLWDWCLHHPLLLANALFFINVNCLFWLIGTIRSNHWMIDPYWTVIPVMLLHFFAAHPLASYNWWRSWIVVLMTWVWSLRLSHNYFRREHWQWGVREDWRFADMRGQYGHRWWWISFFTFYLPQQVFLIGVCLPLYAIHKVNKPLNIYDVAAVAVCVTGVVVAYFADKQLHEFVTRNAKLKQLGESSMVPNLDKGLWKYSRHPNYFGEQLWWWGLALFAWNLGYGWMFIGAFVNSLCLGYVTVLVEERMVKQEYRAEAYKSYQKSTSVWIPWFKSSTLEAKVKSS